MLPDAKDRSPEDSTTQPASDQDRGETPADTVSGAAQGVPMNLDSATAAVPEPSEDFHLQDCFVTQAWHRPYAAALMESDPVKLAAIIVEAERAMATRYLELCVSQIPNGEIVDLQNASYALAQIKRAIDIAATQKRFVD